MRTTSLITLIAIMPTIFAPACSGARNARDCIDHDVIVDLIERRLEAISELNIDKYMQLVYSSYNEVKEISFRHERSLHELSRSVEERIGTEEFIEFFRGHLLEWNGVTFINVFFRDEWKEPENIEMLIDPRYQGVAVRFRQIVGASLLRCVDGQPVIDLDSQYIDPLESARVVVAAATERNQLLMQRLEEENVRSVDELRAVINERDWVVRVPE